MICSLQMRTHQKWKFRHNELVTSNRESLNVDSTMSIRSMTGFAQVRGQTGQPADAPANGSSPLSFTLALKSVNHRFLDLHFRLPSGTDALEMQLRRLLKEGMARGHVEVTLSLERSSSE